MGLREYWRKRDFSLTPEPRGDEAAARQGEALSFVVQKHAASHLHYDFRLELDGVLLSWSVPKGPSLDPTVKRLAMHTEDHPLDYGDFEGIIPKGQYGGGTVLLWDRGTWTPIDNPRKGYYSGKLKFTMHGEKLKGGFTLVKTRGAGDRDDDRSWLLIKENDAEARRTEEYNLTEARPESVATGRQMEAIAAAQDRVWHSNRAEGKATAQPAKSGRTRAAAGKAKPTPRQIAARVPGAREAPMPKALRPQRPSPADAPPDDGGGWLHEIQIDGARVMARVEGGGVKLLQGREDWTDRIPAIAAAVRALQIGQAVFDGEVAVLLPSGITRPLSPSARGRGGPPEEGGEVIYFIFDLLHLEGYDLTGAPLDARKAALEAILGDTRAARGPLRFSGHIEGSGDDVVRNGCRLALKGIISKRRDAPYEPGRGTAWVRVKCRPTGDLARAGDGAADRPDPGAAPETRAQKKAAPKKAAARATSKKAAAKKATAKKATAKKTPKRTGRTARPAAPRSRAAH